MDGRRAQRQGVGSGRRAGHAEPPEVEIGLAGARQLSPVEGVRVHRLLVRILVRAVLDEVLIRGRNPPGDIHIDVGRRLVELLRPHLVGSDDARHRGRRLRVPRGTAAGHQVAVRAAGGRELADHGVEVLEPVCPSIHRTRPGGTVDGELHLDRQRPLVDIGGVDGVLVAAVGRVEVVLHEAVVLEGVTVREPRRIERIDPTGRGDRQGEPRGALDDVDPVRRRSRRTVVHRQRHRCRGTRQDRHRSHPVRRRCRGRRPRCRRDGVVTGVGQVVHPDRLLGAVVHRDRRRGGPQRRRADVRLGKEAAAQ